MDWWKEKKKKQQILARGAILLKDLIECCDGKSNPIKNFSADEIRKATGNFSDSNNISELVDINSCNWYSGKNKNHDMILVTRNVFSFKGHLKDIFCRDIAISSMVSGHKNFLKLVGCCLEFEGPVMVYHGVKKHYQLHSCEQPWKRRIKIAEDIATALTYLHTAFPRPFVYRILSLEDIILDEDGIAKLSDFSCCVSIPKGETFVRVDNLAGTKGYIDKKYMRNLVVSEETDVFAIGIVMQKLLMGHRRYNEIRVVEQKKGKEEGDDEGDDIVLKFIEERRIDEVTDPEMLKKMGELSEQELCQMKAFGMLSLRCIGHRREVPTMVEVAKELKKIQRSLRNDSSFS